MSAGAIFKFQLKSETMASLVRIVDHALKVILAVLFACLIAVVAYQVIARNILAIPAPWSLELAQLLFSWCIFLGAGLAFRYGQHYTVNLWPDDSPINIIPKAATFLAAVVVLYVLIWHGIVMCKIALKRVSLGLDISEFWFYLPIPVSGVIMTLFLLEKLTTGKLE